MNPTVHLYLLVLGILIMHWGSFLTANVEKDSNFNPNLYACLLTLDLFGLFLSVHSLIKIWKEANEQVKRKNKEVCQGS